MQDAAVVMMAVWLFLFLLGVLWFFLPFAVFGIKPRMDTLIKELRSTNALLAQILAAQQSALKASNAPRQVPPGA